MPASRLERVVSIVGEHPNEIAAKMRAMQIDAHLKQAGFEHLILNLTSRPTRTNQGTGKPAIITPAALERPPSIRRLARMFELQAKTEADEKKFWAAHAKPFLDFRAYSKFTTRQITLDFAIRYPGAHILNWHSTPIGDEHTPTTQVAHEQNPGKFLLKYHQANIESLQRKPLVAEIEVSSYGHPTTKEALFDRLQQSFENYVNSLRLSTGSATRPWENESFRQAVIHTFAQELNAYYRANSLGKAKLGRKRATLRGKPFADALGADLVRLIRENKV